ncbi:hypothetical protein D9M73_165390 [compost metagenome]
MAGKGTDKGGGEHQGCGQDHAVTAQPVDQVAAVQAQQGTGEQGAADYQADVADTQGESVGQVHDEIGQGDCPRQGQNEGDPEQHAHAG